MSKKLMLTTIVIGVLSFCILLIAFLVYLSTQSKDDIPIKIGFSNYANICEKYEGEWLADSNQCNGLTESKCISEGGKYDGCGSACGRYYDGPCIEICAQACYF